MFDDFYGDKFRWFTGVVKNVGEDRARVQVRIFGIHHTEDTERVSNDDLPWAIVLYPTTGGQTSGGNVSHGLVPGTWVMGFFADGEDSQQPVVVGVINGGYNSTNNSPSAGDNSPPANNPNNNTSTPSAENNTVAPSTTQLSGGTNPQKVYNYFWEKLSAENAFTGDKKAIVAAIVGNFNVEANGNCDPQAYNPNDEGESSYGLAQWRGGKYDRATPMFRACGYSAVAKPPNLPPLEKQLDFVWQEFHSSERKAYNILIAAPTIDQAVKGMIAYERDDSYKGGRIDTTNKVYIKKLAAARQILSSMSYTGGNRE